MQAQYTTQDIQRFNSHVSPIPTESGCIEWIASVNNKGYGKFNVTRDGKYIGLIASRAAYEIANGLAPRSLGRWLFVCHTCDNPRCVNPEHLFLGTPSDNTMDASRKGRLYSDRGVRNPKKGLAGERNVMAKLTEDDVREIRHLVASGMMQKDVAPMFGVGRMTISRVVRRELWGHVT